jgi:hypothetical protein
LSLRSDTGLRLEVIKLVQAAPTGSVRDQALENRYLRSECAREHD